MERTFPPKQINLVANTTGTLTWNAVDFGPRFNESIIKKAVSIRFSCSTITLNSVNCGVRYSTLTKTYQVSERQTLFVIPASGSCEITPASKPALGLLNEWITSISLDLTSASAGLVTVTLIIDDDPPPLSADPGELIGLDQRLNADYLPIVASQVNVIVPGTNPTNTIYTVPPGKRFIIDLLFVRIDPTPSAIGAVVASITISIAGIGQALALDIYSLLDQHVQLFANQAAGIMLQPGGFVQFANLNFSSVNKDSSIQLYGREVF